MALQHLRSSTADKRPTPAAMSDGQLAVNTNAASTGLFFKDSAGALVKVGPMHVGTTAPNASPAVGGETGNTVGEQWLDTTGGTYVFKVWDGSAWRSEAAGATGVTSVTATSPLASSGGTTPDISIQDGTTAQKGAVQLTDSTSSTSTTTAATPNAVKSAYDLASAAVPKSLVDAKGDLLVATADDTVSRLAVGSNDQVLTADSTTGTGLKWADAGGGAWNFISSVTASNSASVAFTSGIDDTYSVYVIIGDTYVPSVNPETLAMRFSSNGGSSYYTSGYVYSSSSTWTQPEIEIGGGTTNATGASASCLLTLHNLRNSGYKIGRREDVRINTSGQVASSYSLFGLQTTNTINAIQFYFRTGNITSGTFRLYGISNS